MTTEFRSHWTTKDYLLYMNPEAHPDARPDDGKANDANFEERAYPQLPRAVQELLKQKRRLIQEILS